MQACSFPRTMSELVFFVGDAEGVSNKETHILLLLTL